MLTQGFHEDAPVADVAAVLDDAGILALAASITRAKASRLVQEFGSLGAVVAAPVSRLIASGLTSRMADRVKVISSAVQTGPARRDQGPRPIQQLSSRS